MDIYEKKLTFHHEMQIDLPSYFQIMFSSKIGRPEIGISENWKVYPFAFHDEMLIFSHKCPCIHQKIAEYYKLSKLYAS